MTCNLLMSDQVNGLVISLLTSIYISTYRRWPTCDSHRLGETCTHVLDSKLVLWRCYMPFLDQSCTVDMTLDMLTANNQSSCLKRRKLPTLFFLIRAALGWTFRMDIVSNMIWRKWNMYAVFLKFVITVHFYACIVLHSRNTGID